MITVTGVRFRKAGKIYYFDPAGIELEAQQHVIVETVRGVEYGTVVLPAKEVGDKDVVQPLKKVLRIATSEDDDKELGNREKEREAFEICQSKIRKHELDMKLIDCEFTFDNNKLLFYFTADGRVDFRELVKDLASVFKTRIELRQIGVRDETKMMGSIGICGRTLCCHAHLSDFHPVSIKMAKDQNLSLNPTKISGVCGRLMCCLKYEEATYRELNKNLPRVGSKVRIKESGVMGDVIKTNIIRQRVKLVVRKFDGDTEVVEMKLEELDLLGGRPNRRPDKAKGPKGKGEAGAEARPEAKPEEKSEGQEKTEEEGRNRNRNRRPRNDKKKQQGNRDNKKGGNQQQKPKQKQQPKKQGPKGKPEDGNKDGDKKKEGGSRRNRRPRNRNNQNKKKDGGQAQKPGNSKPSPKA